MPRRGAAERHRLVSLAYEHGPALGVGMQSDGRYAAPVLGIQFSYGPNQAYRGLTSVDHCNSSGKRDCQLAGVGHSLSVWRDETTERTAERVSTERIRARLSSPPEARYQSDKATWRSVQSRIRAPYRTRLMFRRSRGRSVHSVGRPTFTCRRLRHRILFAQEPARDSFFPPNPRRAHDVVRCARTLASRPVQDLLGIAENVTSAADPAGLMRDLLAAAGMTLKNPAGIVAANARLFWGCAGGLSGCRRTRDRP